MSELLGNPQARRQQLKQIILELHAGRHPDQLKQEFRELLEDVGANEIGQLEQDLIGSGELTEQEVKKLCDLHAAVFHDSLEQQGKVEVPPGHPIHTFQKENRALEGVFAELRGIWTHLLQSDTHIKSFWKKWQDQHHQLLEIEKHFSRKENIIFPYLEKHGFLGPSKVMWSLQDDIRGEIKKISKFLAGEQAAGEGQVTGDGQVAGDVQVKGDELRNLLNEVALPLLAALEGLIFKEENILFPMCLQNFTEAEWVEIYRQSGEIGFTLVEPDTGWQPALAAGEQEGGKVQEDGFFKLETGLLSGEQINMIFNHLPVDVTFVDKEDVVRYYSQGPERIFVRTPAVIGRKVQNCHPPESVHVVEKIVSDFKSGKREQADFWLHYNGMYVYISYYALRDKAGNYAGTLEVTQNIKPLLELQGEKRILQHD